MKEHTLSYSHELLIPVERNLEKYPFFLTNRWSDDGVAIVYHETVDVGDGVREECVWEVSGHGILGLPGAFDQDLYMGVLRMLDELEGPDETGRLWFKLYDLLAYSGMGRTGAHYERAKQSIERIGTATVRTKNTFYSPRLGRRIRNQKFQVWDSDLIDHEGRRGSNLETNWIRFHEVFLDSYRNGYVDRLDAEFYSSLRRPLTKRWFRLLNEQCDENGRWKANIFAIRDLVPLSRHYVEAKEIKKQARKAHEELERRGFLAEARFTGRGKATEIEYRLAPHFGRRRTIERVEADNRGRVALGLLCSYRMSREDAAELVRDHGADQCIRAAEEIPNQRTQVRRPVGWLKQALREGWEFPERLKPELSTYQTKHRGRRNGGGHDRSLVEDRAGRLKETHEVFHIERHEGSGNLKGEVDMSGIDRADGDENPQPTSIGGRHAPETKSEAREIWNAVLARVDNEADLWGGVAWFEESVPHGFKDGVLFVSVPNSVAKNYIKERFRPLLERYLSNHLGTEASIEISARDRTGYDA